METSNGNTGRLICMLNLIVFAACAVFLFLPFYRIDMGGHTYHYSAYALFLVKKGAWLLALSPALGLLLSLLSLSRLLNAGAVAWGMVHILGLLLFVIAKPIIFEYGNRFYTMAQGASLTMAAYGAGIAVNLWALMRKRKA